MTFDWTLYVFTEEVLRTDEWGFISIFTHIKTMIFSNKKNKSCIKCFRFHKELKFYPHELRLGLHKGTEDDINPQKNSCCFKVNDH